MTRTGRPTRSTRSSQRSSQAESPLDEESRKVSSRLEFNAATGKDNSHSMNPAKPAAAESASMKQSNQKTIKVTKKTRTARKHASPKKRTATAAAAARPRPRNAKRKALEALETFTDPHAPSHPPAAALDLSKSPADIASILLACLPEDATIKHKHSKNLLKALDLAKAELQHRSNLRIQTCQAEGTRLPLEFANGQISVNEDVFLHILNFLPKTDVVLKSSLVSKAWLSMSRSPQLWHTLDTENALIAASRQVTNMDHLLALLNRPQFASLKTLVPPDKVRLRKKALEKIAEACPLLEMFDAGYSIWSVMQADDKTLSELPSVFPHLTGVRFDTRNVTRRGLFHFIQEMGSRLLDIRISAWNYYLVDDDLQTIARSCPNLKHFRYQLEYKPYYKSDFDGVSAEGIISLLQSCRNLENLQLVHIVKIGIEAFQYISDNLHQNSNLSSLLVVTESDLLRDQIQELLHDRIKALRVLPYQEYQTLVVRKARSENQNWY